MTSGGAPLAGRRIVVTRAAEQAGPLVQRLRDLGATPVEVPLIEIVDPSDGGAAVRAAMSRVGDFDWIVVTSPNAARRVAAGLVGRSGRPRIAAVGTATETALGVTADLVPAVQTADGLAAELPDGPGSVLLIEPERRAGGPSPLHRALAAKGWTVSSVEAYRTIPVAPSSRDLLQVLSADAALFASGSAVRAWVDVFGTQAPAVTAAIGPSTAQVAADLGLKIDVVAADHSLDGLVDGLVAYFSDPV